MSLPPFSPFWFWIGVFFGGLLLYLLGSLRVRIARWREAAAKRRAEREENRRSRAAAEWRQWVAKQVQGNHIAAPLFALEEVALPPRLSPRPPAYLPKDAPRPDDIATSAVPYAPDFAELATLYRSPTLTWEQALSRGANLLLLAPSGAGKTTALSYLALRLAHQDPALGNLREFIPLFVHAADLPLPLGEEEPLQVLLEALRKGAPKRALSSLEAGFHGWLETGEVLLLVDGADELPPRRQPALADFLKQLHKAHPRLRMVVAASPAFSDGLQAVGLVPIGLALWSADEAMEFLERWGSLWQEHISPAQEQEEDLPTLLLNRWILADGAVFWPLALTLKAWAAYAGDALGGSFADSLEAYVRRFVVAGDEDNAEQVRAALEQAALGLLQGDGEPVKPKHLPSALFEQGLLRRRDGGFAFSHPILQAYLAALAMDEETAAGLAHGDWWEVRTTVLGFLLGLGKGAALAKLLVERDDAPVHADALALARASIIAESLPPEHEAVKLIAKLFADPTQPLSLRVRLGVALALSSVKGMGALIRKLLAYPNLTVRWSAALAVGLRRDSKAIEPLKALLDDRSRAVQRAAALALAAIGTTSALEVLADKLLNGDDTQRRISAEALANHVAEGWPTLREAAFYEDDLRVRRAAVFGLARIGQEWALDLLKQLQVEDSQWVVRDAATAAVERIEAHSIFAPAPLRPLHEMPWLIEFAAERGVGVSPGKPALHLLHEVLRAGAPLHQEAALEVVPYFPAEPWAEEIYPLLNSNVGELRDAAFLAFWLLHIAGALG